MTDDQRRDIGEQIQRLNELTRSINERADELSRYQDQMAEIGDALKQSAALALDATWPAHEYDEAVRDLERLEAAREDVLSALGALGVDRELFKAPGE